jgi:hypothetical protein
MNDIGVSAREFALPIETRGDLIFPALRQRRVSRTIEPNIDVERRVLWRAYQHGQLSDDELASTLDRLEFVKS